MKAIDTLQRLVVEQKLQELATGSRFSVTIVNDIIQMFGVMFYVQCDPQTVAVLRALHCTRYDQMSTETKHALARVLVELFAQHLPMEVLVKQPLLLD